VRDNGKGIEQEKIDSILTGKDNKSGVGMSNINKRLIARYGQGLKVTSAPGQGTTVEIKIPLAELWGSEVE